MFPLQPVRTLKLWEFIYELFCEYIVKLVNYYIFKKSRGYLLPEFNLKMIMFSNKALNKPWVV